MKSRECARMNEEDDIKLIQAMVFGRAVSLYYKLQNGLTVSEMFRRFALSGAKFGVIEIVEDVEEEMKTISGEYTLEGFLDKLDFFLEVISQSNKQSRILLTVEIAGKDAFVAVYPSSRIVEFTANSELRNGENYLSISLDDLVQKKE